MIHRRFHHYEIEKVERPSPGETYVAIDLRLNRKVRIRLLPTYLLGSWNAEMFRREVRAAAALNHPNVISVLEVFSEADRICVVTEFVEGLSLDRIAGQEVLPASEVVKVTRQVASGLAEIHRAQIVHRDLSPRNILIGPQGLVKIIDLGLASIIQDLPEESRPLEERRSRVPYRSPESLLGGAVGPRSDLYSLGVVMFELLTAHLPYEAETPTEIAEAMLTGPHVSVPAYNANVPPRLSQIIYQLLQTDPSARIQTADELLTELKDIKFDVEIDWPSEEIVAPAPLVSGPREVESNLRNSAPASRRVNVWLEHGALPLEVGTKYKIGINIGAPRNETVGGGEFHEPLWGNRNELELLILLTGRGVKVEPAWCHATLPKHRDMDKVYFHVVAYEAHVIELYLSIFLQRELTLLEEFRITLETVAPLARAAL